MNCTGCDRPVWEAHKTIEEHIACESAQQKQVASELDAQDANKPKPDRRFLARNAGRKIRKGF